MRNTYSTLTLDRARFTNSLWRRLTPCSYGIQLSVVSDQGFAKTVLSIAVQYLSIFDTYPGII